MPTSELRGKTGLADHSITHAINKSVKKSTGPTFIEENQYIAPPRKEKKKKSDPNGLSLPQTSLLNSVVIKFYSQ